MAFPINEPPAEHVRNAMAIISCISEVVTDSEGNLVFALPVQEREAIMARLAAAVEKLEHPITFTMHGANKDCPDVIAGRAVRCPGHRQ